MFRHANDHHHRLLARSLLIGVASFASAQPPVHAALSAAGRSVLTATSCEASVVQQALDDALDGAIVDIPAGTCDWGSASVSLSADKSVWLRGAGIGQTVIERSGGPGDTFALTFDCADVRQVELSGFTFQGRHSSVADSGVQLDNSCRDFKIHDMRFVGFTSSGLEVRDSHGGSSPYSRGVIYDSRFEQHFNPASPSDGEGYGVVVYGSHNALPLELGTAEAVFIEDNHFEANRHSIASNYGSRYVARHNTVVTTDITRNTGLIDAHGRQDGSDRGSRSWEIYSNHISFHGDDYWADGIAIRGGGGVIFDNTIDYEGATEKGIAYSVQFVIEEQACPDYAEPPQGTPGVSYPVADQVHDAWVWNNVHHRPDQPGNTAQFIRVTNDSSWDCRFYIQEGRDYFQFAKPNYQPFTYPHPLRGDADVIFANGFN